ncbi:hypothetical protein AYI69_g9062 [Smittium culicis]|uniref:Uncharacterized protein n=1 Tax=Smittium culicis TaxID=133412 RepID=A0A1R1XF44_9FUNG|nr:hypothetical protein AYI69_g9062 [Smittium culicis]
MADNVNPELPIKLGEFGNCSYSVDQSSGNYHQFPKHDSQAALIKGTGSPLRSLKTPERYDLPSVVIELCSRFDQADHSEGIDALKSGILADSQVMGLDPIHGCDRSKLTDVRMVCFEELVLLPVMESCLLDGHKCHARDADNNFDDTDMEVGI